MAVRIAHASIDENGRASGGQVGDQTTKECCVRTWYNKPWNLLLRPKNSILADKSATFAEKVCANDNVGYDQSNRNSLYAEAKKVNFDATKLPLCECDCSSLVHTSAIAGGANIPYGSNGATTRTLRTVLGNSGYYDIITNSEYLNSDKLLKRGDILVKEGSHTVIVLDNGEECNSNVNDKLNPSYNNGHLVIDVSHHNTINIDMITETDSIIIRAGYISYQSGALTTDKKFKQYITSALKHNMKVGIYAWDQSLNESEAIKLAEYIINLVRPYKITLPIFIDSESYKNNLGRADNISVEQRTKNIIAFCETIKKAGYIPGVYASDSWFKSKLDFNKIKQYEIWCARYSTNKPTIGKYEAWQFGSQNFSWATAPIDVNWFYKEYKTSSNNNPIITDTNTSSNIVINNVVNVTTSLNVRNNPNINAEIVGQLKNGDTVNIIDYSNGWFKIGENKWASSMYISNTLGKVTAYMLNIRSGVGTTNSIIGVLTKDMNVRILREEKGWLQILANDKYGWVSGKYIQLL